MFKSILVETLSLPSRKARTVNATDTSFPSKVPTATEPTGTGATATGQSVIDIGYRGAVAQNAAVIFPYGLGDDNDVFAMRVYGWFLSKGSSQASPVVRDVWYPVKLLELTCTMCAATGVLAGSVLDTERFCDTLAIVGTSGTEGRNFYVVSPADDTIGYAMLDIVGCQKLEFAFDMTTGNPTNANALIMQL